ncbi:hypothetical protein SKAU_G00301070 [Synaphobranchus kaupii]|uniref:Uncharacterized protein n=1 Tax=Synaphobranchus kaupii TaxID=118154 RepID=A0A9Q1IN15_SYNKA|nr:hypothetical protein SKAU_G00301070 [Synaphobranchus kaupii]
MQIFGRLFAKLETQQGGHCDHAGVNGSLLLSVLADRYPSPAQPSVWTCLKERHHLVPAVPLALGSVGLGFPPPVEQHARLSSESFP